MTNGAAPGSLRDQLQEIVRNSITLNERLERVLPTPLHTLPGEVRHGKVSAAPIPWYSRAAYLILDLHAQAREMESVLRLIAGQPVRDRGGSNINTYKALESVVALSWAVDDGKVQECKTWLEGWEGKARIALGEADEPRRLPRHPGQPDPSCPYCSQRTLRFWALERLVRCINPSCYIDEEHKKRAIARMEFSGIVGDFVLVWSDNSVGLGAAV